MGLQFEADRDTLEGAFTEAAEAFGKAIIDRLYEGNHGMDWSVTGGETWGGNFAFDFEFRHGEDATGRFQLQLVNVRGMVPEPLSCGICGCLGEADEFEMVPAEDGDGEGPVCADCYAEYCSEQEGNGCPECARSYGPNYHGPCDH